MTFTTHRMEIGDNMSSNDSSNDTNLDKPKFQFNTYATKKTVAKGLLNISLLMANGSQLKAMLNAGTSADYFWVVVVLVFFSVALQLAVAAMLLALGSMQLTSQREKYRADRLNNASVACICAITVVNIFISSFGFEISG